MNILNFTMNQMTTCHVKGVVVCFYILSVGWPVISLILTGVKVADCLARSDASFML